MFIDSELGLSSLSGIANVGPLCRYVFSHLISSSTAETITCTLAQYFEVWISRFLLMLSRLSCACILEKHVTKTDIKHWSVVLFSSFWGPFYRFGMFGNAYSVDLFSPWTKNPWTFFLPVADFSVAIFSVDLLTVDRNLSTVGSSSALIMVYNLQSHGYKLYKDRSHLQKPSAYQKVL